MSSKLKSILSSWTTTMSSSSSKNSPMKTTYCYCILYVLITTFMCCWESFCMLYSSWSSKIDSNCCNEINFKRYTDRQTDRHTQTNICVTMSNYTLFYSSFKATVLYLRYNLLDTKMHSTVFAIFFYFQI